MLLFDAPLTFREFMTHEELPLATLFAEVLRFLGGRSDAVLFGAQAVNAYCETERMTHDVYVMSTQAAGLAEALRAHLTARFHIAARVREVVKDSGFRVYQVRKPKNRHLVDVRQVDELPSHVEFERVRVVAPIDLVAMKVLSLVARRGQEKELSDRLDIHRLLNTFPALRTEAGAVLERLHALGAAGEALALWREIVHQPIRPDEDGGY